MMTYYFDNSLIIITVLINIKIIIHFKYEIIYITQAYSHFFFNCKYAFNQFKIYNFFF